MLGLGSQIKPHIKKRFSMPWSHPAPRMREFILAMRAIWALLERRHQARLPRRVLHAHADDAVLQPAGRTRTAPPKVFLAGVGELMTEVAGEVGRRLPLPRLHDRAVRPRGHAARARRGARPRPASRGGLRGRRPAVRRHRHAPRRRWRRPRRGVRQQIAFYGSTPAYRGVLELHGWGDLQTELNALSKQGEWVEMGELIDDDMLEHVRRRRRARARRRRAAAPLRRRDDRMSLYTPYALDPAVTAQIVADLRAAG